MTAIAVFGSSTTVAGSHDWSVAEGVGRAIAERGWAVMTGGYGGTMEAVSAGAAAAGGRVIGITAPTVFPERSGANTHIGEEIAERTISHRIAHLVESSDGVIALPGSIGTFAELVVAWNAAFVAPFRGAAPIPVVAVGAQWSSIVELVQTQLPTGSGFVHLADTTEIAMSLLDGMISKNPHDEF
ncbi:MAG: LOG family protein [Acidimicrobiia bacterium]